MLTTAAIQLDVQLKDEHLYGIIGVLLVHMVVLLVLTFQRIDNAPAIERTVPVSFIAEEMRDLEETIADLEAENALLTAAAKPKESFDQRLKRDGFENDPVNLDQEMRERLEQSAAEAAAADAAQAAADAGIGADAGADLDPFIATASTEGTSVVEYFLKGRSAMIYNPVYRCEKGGDVHVDVWVNKTGNVVKSKVNEDKSTVNTSCLDSEAERAAFRFRFSPKSDAQDPQQGYILFRFMPDI